MPFQTGQGEDDFSRWASARNKGKIVSEGVEVNENAGGGFVTSVFTLKNAKVPVVSVSTGRGVGGLTLATLPEGLTRILGGSASLTVSVAGEDQADFTDGTPEGDIGVGTLAPANNDALGTDATDDNICTAAAFTLASFTGSASLTSDVSSVLAVDGTAGSPVNLVLTAAVDAADIDDDTSSFITVSGRVTVVWADLGDDD